MPQIFVIVVVVVVVVVVAAAAAPVIIGFCSPFQNFRRLFTLNSNPLSFVRIDQDHWKPFQHLAGFSMRYFLASLGSIEIFWIV